VHGRLNIPRLLCGKNSEQSGDLPSRRDLLPASTSTGNHPITTLRAHCPESGALLLCARVHLVNPVTGKTPAD